MGYAIDLVNKVTQDMLPSSVVLPVGLSAGYSVVHYLHGTWRWYRWGKKHADVDNLFKIAADHGFAFLVGDNKVVQLAAQCVMIVRCISDGADGYVKLFRSYQKLEKVVRGQYPYFEEKPWVKESPVSWISPSGWHSITASLEKAAFYISQMVQRIFKLMQALFTLSMLMLDAVDAFSMSASKRHEAVGEMVSNSSKLINQSAGNAALLLEKLKANRAAIQEILKSSGTGCTAEQLIGGLESIVQKTEGVKGLVNEIDSQATDAMVHYAKVVTFDLFQTIGLAAYIPGWLLPPITTKPPKPKRIYGRYAPTHWVTRLDRQPKGTTKMLDSANVHKETPHKILGKKVHAIYLTI